MSIATDTRDQDLWNHPRIGDWQEEVHNGDTLRSFREWLDFHPEGSDDAPTIHPECQRFGYVQDGRCCGHAPEGVR